MATSNASLQSVGSFTVAAWYKVDSASDLTWDIVGKGDPPSYEFGVRNANASSLRAYWSTNGTTDTVAINAGDTTLNQWHFGIAWLDSVAGTCNAQLNANAPVSSSVGTLFVGNGAWSIGASATGLRPMNGLIGPVGRWSRALSREESLSLYNAGRGVSYGTLPPSLLPGLVSWWDLDEPGGTRYDRHGQNHLTPVNDPGSSNGIVAGPDVDDWSQSASSPLLLRQMLAPGGQS